MLQVGPDAVMVSLIKIEADHRSGCSHTLEDPSGLPSRGPSGAVRCRQRRHPTKRRRQHADRTQKEWKMGYNAIGIPVATGVLYPTFGILLSPVVAALAMSLSSVSVIGNALRLRAAHL